MSTSTGRERRRRRGSAPALVSTTVIAVPQPLRAAVMEGGCGGGGHLEVRGPVPSVCVRLRFAVVSLQHCPGLEQGVGAGGALTWAGAR